MSAQRGSRVATLYSNVFDLKARTAHLYLLCDFEHPVVLDLAEELARGARTLRLPDLFPHSPRYEQYTAALTMTLEERIAARRGPALTPEQLSAFGGDYVIEADGRSVELSMRPEESALVATSRMFQQAQGRVVFHSSGPDEFFMINEVGELGATFHRDEAGAVVGFTLDLGARQLEATRVRAQ